MDTSLTPKQQYAFQCVENSKTISEAASKYGCCERAFRRLLSTAAKNGHEAPKTLHQIKQNMIPGQVGLPDGFKVYQQTTHVQVKDDDGTVKNIWHRSSPDKDAIESFSKALLEKVKGKGPYIKIPKHYDKDSCLLTPWGDPHIGMYAWQKETRDANYNTKIAVDLHKQGFMYLLEPYKAVDKIYIVPLGDTLHTDNRKGVTEQHGHNLDTDTRFWDMIHSATDLFKFVVEESAKKAKNVYVLMPPGNHDWHASGIVANMLAQYYYRSKHIHIETSPTKQHYVQYYKNLFAIFHGDSEKEDRILGMVTNDAKEMWGKTDHHYALRGHTHEEKVIQKGALRIETFPTLAPRDAYATENAFISKRKMNMLRFDRYEGLVERREFKPFKRK